MKFAVFNINDDSFWGYVNAVGGINPTLHYAIPNDQSKDPVADAAYYTALKATYNTAPKRLELRNNYQGRTAEGVVTNRTGNASTATADTYVRYVGSGPGTETIPTASGSNRSVTYKNKTSFAWTLSHATSTMDGMPSVTLGKDQAITIIDTAPGIWDIN